jgi:hypothetical protein
MQSYDISHLPPPIREGVLRFLETLVQAFPLAGAEAGPGELPAAASPPRFPRGATELLVLEALEALAPMPATPMQLAGLVNKPHLEVRSTLQALAMLGTIAHVHKGYYRHGPPVEPVRPSTRFAAQIAAFCAPSTRRDPTAAPARGGAVSPTEGVDHV